MNHFAVTAVGADRNGIVAAVTRVLAEHGCNLEDSSMTILRGQFAMMLVVAAPMGVDTAELQAALAGPAADLGLVVTVRPITEPSAPVDAPDVTSWTVSVHGVTSLLAAAAVNIVDLTTRFTCTAGDPVYTMILQVTLPAAVDPRHLERRLEIAAGELGVTCRLHPSEADIL